MKKLFILSVAICFNLLVSNAQTFLLQEGFENGLPAGWRNVDADGDGQVWVVREGEDGFSPHNGNSCITSDSYDLEEDEPLTPDNYLITTAIQIPSELTEANRVALWWWVAAQDGNFPADHYEIYVSTTGNDVADFTDPAVYSETITSDEWRLRVVNLSDYIGQTIYIAFVHNQCEDEFVMKLDDIEVSYFTEPTLLVGTEEIDFGYVVVGEQSQNRSFAVTTAFLNESLAVSVMPPFEISSCGLNFSQRITIPADLFTTIYVRYAPTEAGTHVGSAEISSGDFLLSVTLHGTGVDCSEALALPFHEEFEVDISPCWTNSDLDEDGMTWMWVNEGFGHESDGCYVSMSYDEEEWMDILPNDWLITPRLAIPANGAHLSWWVAAYAEDWPVNVYDVLISTTGTAPENFISVFSEATSTETFQQRTLDLSDYAGQNIHIAFAHHTYTNEIEDSYGLVIDDISVEAGTGIFEEVETAAILLYPNPASDVLNISSVNGCEILIYNALGQIVHQDKAVGDEVRVDTHAFAPGTYFVHVKGEKNCVKRFVVK